jgi:hypothetical protein
VTSEYTRAGEERVAGRSEATTEGVGKKNIGNRPPFLRLALLVALAAPHLDLIALLLLSSVKEAVKVGRPVALREVPDVEARDKLAL